jgi:hypothetical protein
VVALLAALRTGTGDDFAGPVPKLGAEAVASYLALLIDPLRRVGWHADTLGHFAYTLIVLSDVVPSVPHGSVTTVELKGGLLSVVTATLAGWLWYFDATRNDDVGGAFEEIGLGDLFYKRELTCLSDPL